MAHKAPKYNRAEASKTATIQPMRSQGVWRKLTHCNWCAATHNKAASKPENAFALLLLLDGSVFVEVKAKGAKSLETALKAWKAENLNSLARSDVRYFYRDGQRDIAEVTF